MDKAGWSAVLVATLMLAGGAMVQAQQPKTVPRLAYVDTAGTPNAPEESFKGFNAGLRELGYVDGQKL